MTHHLFHHYDLIATGILLCMFLALLTVMAAKFTCRNKHTESQPPKEEKHPSGYRLEKTVLEKETSREEPKRKRNKSPYYESQFIQEAGITARTGKSVYIRKAHHDKITKIVQVIGKNQVSLFSYIDNVLNHHFETYQDEIKELYDKNNEGFF